MGSAKHRDCQMKKLLSSFSGIRSSGNPLARIATLNIKSNICHCHCLRFASCLCSCLCLCLVSCPLLVLVFALAISMLVPLFVHCAFHFTYTCTFCTVLRCACVKESDGGFGSDPCHDCWTEQCCCSRTCPCLKLGFSTWQTQGCLCAGPHVQNATLPPVHEKHFVLTFIPVNGSDEQQVS